MSTEALSAKARTRIRKPPAVVFNAFADAREMSKFWFTRRDDGLKEGESVTWSMGSGADEFSFEVRITELSHPKKIVMEWPGPDGNYTQVTWSFDATDDGDTVLTIEESGFTGDTDAIIGRVLDSTGGFNQVIIAAKALIEHGVAVNVVSDHA